MEWVHASPESRPEWPDDYVQPEVEPLGSVWRHTGSLGTVGADGGFPNISTNP